MSRIEPETLGRIYDEHAAPLLLYARQICDSPEDVVHEAFIALSKQRAMPAQVVPWLYRVVRNRALATNRSNRRRQHREAKAGPKADAASPWFASVDDQIDARRAQAVLAEVDPEIREVIVARIWGGLTFDKIARVLGCSLTTAHRRYQTGLAQLLERLETYDSARPFP